MLVIHIQGCQIVNQVAPFLPNRDSNGIMNCNSSVQNQKKNWKMLSRTYRKKMQPEIVMCKLR